MNDKEQVVKHIEIVQGIINRLAHNSFLIKGWSMAILAAGVIFIARTEVQTQYFVFAFLAPVIGFWILDGYFLWKERLFREIYKEISKQENTDFVMNTRKHKNKPNCSWLSSILSIPLIIFYPVEISFVVAVFVFLILESTS